MVDIEGGQDALGDVATDGCVALENAGAIDVETGAFPAEEHIVRMKPDEWQSFVEGLPPD